MEGDIVPATLVVSCDGATCQENRTDQPTMDYIWAKKHNVVVAMACTVIDF